MQFEKRALCTWMEPSHTGHLLKPPFEILNRICNVMSTHIEFDFPYFRVVPFRKIFVYIKKVNYLYIFDLLKPYKNEVKSVVL